MDHYQRNKFALKYHHGDKIDVTNN